MLKDIFFLIQRIFFSTLSKEKIEGSSYFDFESAYGYGGPLTTSIDKDFLSRCWKKIQR